MGTSVSPCVAVFWPILLMYWFVLFFMVGWCRLTL